MELQNERVTDAHKVIDNDHAYIHEGNKKKAIEMGLISGEEGVTNEYSKTDSNI